MEQFSLWTSYMTWTEGRHGSLDSKFNSVYLYSNVISRHFTRKSHFNSMKYSFQLILIVKRSRLQFRNVRVKGDEPICTFQNSTWYNFEKHAFLSFTFINYYRALLLIKSMHFIITYGGKIKSPAVGQVHLDEAVELLAHPLQADNVLQRQVGQNVWNENILPRQVQEMTSAGKQTLLQLNFDSANP